MRKFVVILAFILLTMPVYAQTLTAIDVIKEEYTGYKALKGYDNENLYQIYFKGTRESCQITFENLKKVDMNEVVNWQYNDTTIESTRRDLYKFFSDTSYFSSRKEITDTSKLTPIWFHQTFGQIYQDWLDDGVYVNEAQHLVEQYFRQSELSNNRFILSE